MQAVYLFTNGDTTTRLAKPLEVYGYGCGVIGVVKWKSGYTKTLN